MIRDIHYSVCTLHLETIHGQFVNPSFVSCDIDEQILFDHAYIRSQRDLTHVIKSDLPVKSQRYHRTHSVIA